MDVDQVARICHEANRVYCQSIGDYSQSIWEDAPDWQKESARKGVLFHAFNKNASASSSHESWLEEKRRAGWKYGPVKDAEKKEHPCFVPFEELPVEQKLKDHLFRGIVHAFMDSESPKKLTAREIVDFVYPKQKPSIGRIVIYKHPGSADGKYPPQESPAIIQRPHAENPNLQTSGDRLWVFGPQGIFWVDAFEGDGPCTWHWPPRV